VDYDKEKADAAFKAVKAARAAMNELRDKKIKAERDHVKAIEKFVLIRWGVKTGSIVTCRGVVYRVVSMQLIFRDDADEKPWLRGNLKKKDGKFGTSIRGIGNEWDVCSEGETSERPGNN
jgi:hypothetical protein